MAEIHRESPVEVGSHVITHPSHRLPYKPSICSTKSTPQHPFFHFRKICCTSKTWTQNVRQYHMGDMKILQVMNSLQFFVSSRITSFERTQGLHPPRTTRTLWSWILEYRNPTTSLHFADCHLESNLQSPGPAGSLQWKPRKL